MAGAAIDVFLAGQLRLLRQEHTLARAIHGVQAALWPGGTWFMYRPEYPKRPVPDRCPPLAGTQHPLHVGRAAESTFRTQT